MSTKKCQKMKEIKNKFFLNPPIWRGCLINNNFVKYEKISV